MSDMKKLLFLFVGFVVLASCNSPKTQKVYITFPVEQWVMDYGLCKETSKLYE